MKCPGNDEMKLYNEIFFDEKLEVEVKSWYNKENNGRKRKMNE